MENSKRKVDLGNVVGGAEGLYLLGKIYHRWDRVFLKELIGRNRKTEEASECFLSAFYLKPCLLDALKRFLQISPTLNDVNIKGVLSVMDHCQSQITNIPHSVKGSLQEALNQAQMILRKK